MKTETKDLWQRPILGKQSWRRRSFHTIGEPFTCRACWEIWNLRGNIIGNKNKKKQTQNMHLASTTKWWTGRSGVLRFMRLQRVRHDWATELNWTSGEVAQRLMSTSSEWEFDVEEWDASSILRVSTGFQCPEDNLKDLIWDSYPNHGIARERKKKAPFP